jgi:hypothetical protein
MIETDSYILFYPQGLQCLQAVMIMTDIVAEVCYSFDDYLLSHFL